ncbi:MAG: SemiSWEET transporter [Bacteroidetes bacterium]|nr:SemiSWEET transporter [Bacteroidota bacterium]
MGVETRIGIIASVFTGIALLPQLIKIIKEKKSTGVSFLMLSSMFVGISLWIWYGFMKDDYIIIISNAFSLIVNILIVLLSIKYKHEV